MWIVWMTQCSGCGIRVVGRSSAGTYPQLWMTLGKSHGWNSVPDRLPTSVPPVTATGST